MPLIFWKYIRSLEEFLSVVEMGVPNDLRASGSAYFLAAVLPGRWDLVSVDGIVALSVFVIECIGVVFCCCWE